jgi:hypothetical protein
MSCTNGDKLPIAVPTQRLNATQFNAVIGSLFGPKIAPKVPFPPSAPSAPYETYSSANSTGEGEAEAILEAAESVAMQVVDIVPACAGAEPGCATSYLTDLATRAFRRAPTADELATIMGTYTHARATMSYAEGVGVGVETILQMPQFLYLVEEEPAAASAAPIALTGAEIAQRMALLYWNDLPDDELTKAGAAGSLADPNNRRAEAQRMLQDPRASATLVRFVRQWLTVLNFQDTVHTPDVAAALTEELSRDIGDALSAPSGVAALFTSSRTWVNSVLETFYGLPAKSSGPTDWYVADLDPAMRVGLLTNPLLLTQDAHGVNAPSPILRGKFVRVMLMCDVIPPPPPNAQAMQASLTPAGATIREQSQARIASGSCGACHSLMDPIGFGFSAFDGAGHYAPVAGGTMVDVSGHVASTSELGGDFSGVRALGQELAASPKAQACLATQWMRYAFGVSESSDETCIIQTLASRFEQQGYSLPSLFAELAAFDGFALRAGGGS